MALAQELPQESLVFLFRNGKIFLAEKKRGFGAGKLNGYGGKFEEKKGDKTILDCACREVKDESTLDIKPDSFKELGYIDFYFDDKPEDNKRVFVYRVDEFEGVPEETEEMKKAELFDFKKIPKERMWEADREFLPSIRDGKPIKGEAHYAEGGRLVSWKDHNSNLNEIKLK